MLSSSVVFTKEITAQNAAANFVLNTYIQENDVLHKLNWLPIKERTEYHFFRLVHKSLWAGLCQIT